MSSTKIRPLLSQHWRHSAPCDCLGSCWRAISLNEDCKHAGGEKKGFWHGRVLFRAKSTQASALTHDSNLSEKSAAKECRLLAAVESDATNHGILWQHVTKILKQKMWWRFWVSCARETCRSLWSPLAGTKWSCTKRSIPESWNPKDSYCTHKGRSDLLAKMWLVKLWT